MYIVSTVSEGLIALGMLTIAVNLKKNLFAFFYR